jgi:hypothetical protein
MLKFTVKVYRKTLTCFNGRGAELAIKIIYIRVRIDAFALILTA